MEEIVDALAGIGLSRDIAVNLATDFLFTVVLGVIVALTANWARDRSEAKNAKRLLSGVYRSADQCIVDYLCAGRTLARLARTDDPTAISDGMDRLSRRCRDVMFEGTRFDERLAMVGAALSRSAFKEANGVSQGLARLREHSAQIDRGLSRWRSEIETGRLSSAIATGRLAVWLDALELSAEQLDSRKAAVASKRRPPRRQRPLRLERLSVPTGRLDLKSLREDEVASLSSVIWRRNGVDRGGVLAILGGAG
jgi:hypothetical protein